MSNTVNDWLREGTDLFNAGLAEYQALDAEALAIQQRLARKREELDRLAKLLHRDPPALMARWKGSSTGPGVSRINSASIANALIGSKRA